MWAKKPYSLLYPGKEHRLGKNKFFQISANLNFDHSVVYELLVKTFQRYMEPGTFVCVDEARIPCKDNNCPFLTYNPSKPHKWAIECLTLSLNNKYLWWFTNPACDTKPTPFQWLINCGTRLSLYKPKNVYHITADTRFSSVDQAIALRSLGIHCTLCCKSVSPKEICQVLGADLQQWRVHLACKDRLVVGSYKQKKTLNLVSSWFKVEEKVSATREDRLPLLNHYDNTKRMTDQFDQLASSYAFNHRHSHFMITLLLGWFVWARTNAFIIYDTLRPGEFKHVEFVTECGRSYLEEALGEEVRKEGTELKEKV
jgi:hypothetical protein